MKRVMYLAAAALVACSLGCGGPAAPNSRPADATASRSSGAVGNEGMDASKTTSSTKAKQSNTEGPNASGTTSSGKGNGGREMPR